MHDGGPGFTPSDGTEAGHNGGFGLAILAALADEWGVESGTDGCTVWCAMNAERDRTHEAAPATGSARSAGAESPRTHDSFAGSRPTDDSHDYQLTHLLAPSGSPGRAAAPPGGALARAGRQRSPSLG